jgi:hypothetical protein
MSTLLRIFTVVAVLGWASAGFTQTLQDDMANSAAQIAQTRKANATLMQQYSWNSRTEIVSNGQVKDTKIELVSYGPDGQLQRSVLNDQAASNGIMLPTPIGFLRRAIADDKKKEMQEYLAGLHGLLDLYTLPTAGKILDFMLTASLNPPDANGLIELSGTNVVEPGDNLNLWVNPLTRQVQHLQVNTTFQGDAVQLTATFETVPVSGLNYVSFAEVTAPSKLLSVQVQNYNYARLGN